MKVQTRMLGANADLPLLSLLSLDKRFNLSEPVCRGMTCLDLNFATVQGMLRGERICVKPMV